MGRWSFQSQRAHGELLVLGIYYFPSDNSCLNVCTLFAMGFHKINYKQNYFQASALVHCITLHQPPMAT